MAGQVPLNTGVGLKDNDYTCNFGFQQEVSDLDYIPSNDKVFYYSSDLVNKQNNCFSGYNYCYIVAGSNSINPVEVTVNNIDPSGYIQNKLENAAANTDNLATDTIFNPFPTGGITGALPRNPLDVCQLNYGCPTYS